MQLESKKRSIVAVGASAGGVQALTALVGGCPADLGAALVVVLHIPSGSSSALASILERAGPFPAFTARNGMVLEPNVVYVASPDRHLVVNDRRVFLTDGPTESGHRPAINALFRSVAVSLGYEGIGVLLSGVLDDGVAGLAAIRSRGGVAVAQEPADAMFPAMPHNAVVSGFVDHVAPAAELGSLLAKLCSERIEAQEMERDMRLEVENRIAMGRRYSSSAEAEQLGPPSGYSCPDCNGTLLELQPSNYRCQVGHAWSAESLLQAQEQEVEKALGIALRSLEEKAKLSAALASRVAERRGPLYQRYSVAAAEAHHAAEVLRAHLAGLYENETPKAASDESV
jgi:two-component system chemotaxis response regulator CheB